MTSTSTRTRAATTIIALAITLVHPRPATSQTVRGIVSSTGGQPIEAASVTLAHPDRGSVGTVFTDANGRFTIAVRHDPPFDLLIQRLGFEAALRRGLGSSLADDDTLEIRIELEVRPVSLSAIRVVGESAPFNGFAPPSGIYHGPEGVFINGRCMYAISDGVLYKDAEKVWELLNRIWVLRLDDTTREIATLRGSLYRSGGLALHWSNIPDRTAQQLMYPCGGAAGNTQDGHRVGQTWGIDSIAGERRVSGGV